MARLADAYVTYRIIRMLATPIEKSDAYKMGIIDADGKKIKNPTTSSESTSGEPVLNPCKGSTNNPLPINLTPLLKKYPAVAHPLNACPISPPKASLTYPDEESALGKKPCGIEEVSLMLLVTAGSS